MNAVIYNQTVLLLISLKKKNWKVLFIYMAPEFNLLNKQEVLEALTNNLEKPPDSNTE